MACGLLGSLVSTPFPPPPMHEQVRDTMTEEFTEGSGSEGKKLDPVEYRQRLLSKLNCLISVLEVAIGKISHNLEGESPNKDRLSRIKTNLENTLAISRRAKATLESRIAESDPKEAKKTGTPASFRSYVELSSIEEFRKFKNLEAIMPEDLKKVDIDDLTRRLMGEEGC